MEKETKHTPETHLEISEGAMYGYRVYKVIDATDPKNRIIFCDCHLEESYAKLIVESVNSAPTLKADLSEMKKQNEKLKDAHNLEMKAAHTLRSELSEMKKEREELIGIADTAMYRWSVLADRSKTDIKQEFTELSLTLSLIKK